MLYYFDNSATTLKKPESVAKAVYDALSSETLGNPSRGAHTPALTALRQLFSVRKSVATLFQLANESRIGFTLNGTMALNMAIKGLVPANSHVITTVLEHNSVLRPLYQLADKGVSLDFVNYDKENGQLCYHEFEEKLTPLTKTVVCTHASNVLGDVVDITYIAKFCHEHQLNLIIDGAQTAGSIEIDLSEINPAAFCFTGHKSLFGPQGTGGIIISEDITDLVPLIVGGSGAYSFHKDHPNQYPDALEAGTANGHSLAGLKAGVDYVITESIEKLHTKQLSLLNQFYQGILSIPDITIYSAVGQTDNVGIIALNIANQPASLVAEMLSENYQIAVRPGAHCAPLIHQTFGTEEQGMVRFSFSSFNTEEEVGFAIRALTEIANQLNK